MKAIIIRGTYHRDGVISELVDNLVAGLCEVQPEAEVSLIDLLDAHIEFCRGCANCIETSPDKSLGDCSIEEDDVRGILEQVLACDVLVFATPVYLYGPTAVMKRFMERMIAMMKPSRMGPTGRVQKRRNKIGVVLLSSGAPYPMNVVLGITRYPSRMLGWLCGHAGCGRVFRLKAGGIQASSKTRERYKQKARKLGRRAAQAAAGD